MFLYRIILLKKYYIDISKLTLGKNMSIFKFILILLITSLSYLLSAQEINKNKKIIYLNNDMNIPFWQIMAKGIENNVKSLGYDFEIYDSKNSSKRELELTVKALKENIAGLIVTPSNSSACVTILRLAKRANVPVVISDIGTDKGEYVSYISSNNKEGAYNIGRVLANKMISKNWQNGKVGIIAIPQKRSNGQLRTAGFMKALKESNIKGADIKQQRQWTDKETYLFTKNMIYKFPELKAIWLQTSNNYKGAVKAIKDFKKEIILLTFDAEPEYIELIKNGIILTSAMQQPYLMGEVAAKTMNKHLNNKLVNKNIEVPILTVSTQNIYDKIPEIKQNVLGIK
jgi:ribose transport system substrate-binding protein